MTSFSFTPFPVLHTQRFVLRQLLPQDAAKIYELRTDETVNKFLQRSKAKSLEDAKQFINLITDNLHKNHSVFWAICFKDEMELVGTICLWNLSAQEGKAEVGYELLPQFHGKGIIHEALEKVLHFGFHTMQLQKIEAWTTAPNTASIKVLERHHFKRNLERKLNPENEAADTVIFSLRNPINS